MRDLFMTESNQVRFGAPLDVLKTAWLGRKKSDEDKTKDKKVCTSACNVQMVSD